MTPNVLAGEFDTSRQAVSKHMKVLTECQLLEQKKVGGLAALLDLPPACKGRLSSG
jgi:hypothetical protein